MNISEPAPATGEADGFVVELVDHGLLRVSGADATSFLQGQLTCDMNSVGVGFATYGGLCSPKGRLLATFLVVRAPDEWLLVVTRELSASIAKRLSMYVLRAKVCVEDASAGWRIRGLAGPGGGALAADVDLPLPAPLAVSGSSPRVIGLAPISVGPTVWPRALALTEEPPRSSQPESLARWQSTEALAGTARVFACTQEAFVPQMINLELIGAVSFTKGCYTGQEVVARSQYLGKLKRRMHLGRVRALVAAGDDILDANGEVEGKVVLAGPGDGLGHDGWCLLLYEARTEDGTPQGVRVANQSIERLDLPYEVPAQVRFERRP